MEHAIPNTPINESEMLRNKDYFKKTFEMKWNVFNWVYLIWFVIHFFFYSFFFKWFQSVFNEVHDSNEFNLDRNAAY